MNKIQYISLLFFSYSIAISSKTEIDTALQENTIVQGLGKGYTSYIPFSFDRKPLIDIINVLMAAKGVNVLFPEKKAESDLIRQQLVTYNTEAEAQLPLNEAWRLLMLFLDYIGFTIVQKNPKLFMIVKNGIPPAEPGVSRRPLPLYIGTKPESLPLTDEHIRYIYYLQNLRVPETAAAATSDPLTNVFREMLSPAALQSTPTVPVIYEPKTNGFIIADKAGNIASAMRIIQELDMTGFKEVIEVIPLYNVPAQDVKTVFANLRAAAGNDADKTSPFIRQDPQAQALSYFAIDTRILDDPRTNSLILMGRETAVTRIAEFIEDYVDSPPESGNSILHYYDLQYLDAQDFEKTLQDIVKTQVSTQSSKEGPATGIERFFTGVQIRAEQRTPIEQAQVRTKPIVLEGVEDNVGINTTDKITTGGNRLIIAATKADWERIKDIIEQLDKPRDQVILQVLVVDFTDTRTNTIATTVRNPTNISGPNNAQFLSSQLSTAGYVIGTNPAINGIPPNPALAQDLLGVSQGDTINNFLASIEAGSTLITINDPVTPGIGAIIQLLQSYSDARIITHPFLVTTDNQKATVQNQNLLVTIGNILPIQAGGVEQKQTYIPATIQVQMWPHISSNTRLNLQVAVDINEFIDPAVLNRAKRRVNTAANISTGQILVIGGLTRITQTDVTTGVPFFSKIPIIGYLFERNSKVLTRTNVAIFIEPTIVQPKLREGLNRYTADKIRTCRRDLSDAIIFDTLHDPITRFFFKDDTPKDQLMREYLEHTSNAPEFEIIKTSKERKFETRWPTKAKATEQKSKVKQLTLPKRVSEILV
jgi:general secretion pathway protein D